MAGKLNGGNPRGLPLLLIYAGAAIVSSITCMASGGFGEWKKHNKFMGPPGNQEEISDQDRELVMASTASPVAEAED
eukprot:SAG22_NODE_561_length_9080_cov_2.242623_1_plen_77_part_00